jgi:sugar-specific transcriptional regulator TrmB
MGKLITRVPSDQIVRRVSKLVSSTKRRLIVTMLLSEEKGVVPHAYYQALSQALERGIQVTRVCFGSKEELKKFSNKFDKGMEVVLVEDVKRYQRMIVSDESFVIFRRGSGYYYESSNARIVRAFCEYLFSMISI